MADGKGEHWNMICGYLFRIYPNGKQISQIEKTFRCCRLVFNRYLDLRKNAYKESGEKISFIDCTRDLTKYKQENKLLTEVNLSALQAALYDLDKAYRNFFRRCRKGENPGYPKYRKEYDSTPSFTVRQCIRISEDGKHVVLPNIGAVKCRVSRNVEGHIRFATVSKNPAGEYYVALCCDDVPSKTLPSAGGSAIGIDLGIKDFAITSNGEKYPNHKFMSAYEKKLSRLYRQLSRKKKGGSNYKKAKNKIARLENHIANQRNDVMQKLSTKVIRENDTICIESLNIKNMVRNHNFAKSIEDASWGEFVRELEYKSDWYGRELVKVDTYFPSSKMCSCCGYKNDKTTDLSVRKWTCPECGATHDRDINAAVNILQEGQRLNAAR